MGECYPTFGGVSRGGQQSDGWGMSSEAFAASRNPRFNPISHQGGGGYHDHRSFYYDHRSLEDTVNFHGSSKLGLLILKIRKLKREIGHGRKVRQPQDPLISVI